MKLNTELQKHLRLLRFQAVRMEEKAPANFASRVLAARAMQRERERAITGVAAMSAALALAILGWYGLRGPAEPAEPACIGWLDMESPNKSAWE